MNPLLLLGITGVGVDVDGTAKLTVSSGEEVVASYESSCRVSMRRSVWTWGTPSNSELRDRALVALRDLIDRQLVASDDPWMEAAKRGRGLDEGGQEE